MFLELELVYVLSHKVPNKRSKSEGPEQYGPGPNVQSQKVKNGSKFKVSESKGPKLKCSESRGADLEGQNT